MPCSAWFWRFAPQRITGLSAGFFVPAICAPSVPPGARPPLFGLGAFVSLGVRGHLFTTWSARMATVTGRWNTPSWR